MPVNTEEAVSSGPPNRYQQIQARLNRRREQLRASVSGAQGNETANVSPENITGAIDDARAAATSAATSAIGEARAAASSAANAFTVGYEAGQVDPALARALAADRASGTPSPSTIQATSTAPSGATTPSAAARQNSTFSSISPRPYFRIDPLDNRYDFLSGQKVNTTGGQPNINTPVRYDGGGNAGGAGSGSGENGNPGTSDPDANDPRDF
jgi:hypothetical protein